MWVEALYQSIKKRAQTHLPCGVRSEGNTISGSVVASVSMVTSSSYASGVNVSGTNVVSLSTSSSSPVGGTRGSVPGSSSGASVGVWGRGNKRPVPFGPDGSASSSTTGLSVVVVVVSATIRTVIAATVVVVVGGVVEGTVVDGSTAGASVRLIEGKVGGTGGGTVALGAPERKTS